MDSEDIELAILKTRLDSEIFVFFKSGKFSTPELLIDESRFKYLLGKCGYKLVSTL